MIGEDERVIGDSGEFLPFLTQPDLPGLPERSRRCLRCGASIAAPKRNGRPRGFCSDQCRRAEASDQRASWVEGNPADVRPTTLRCRTCGDDYPAPPPGRGRFPRFCSTACRKASRRGLAAAYRLRKARIPETPEPRA